MEMAAKVTQIRKMSKNISKPVRILITGGAGFIGAHLVMHFVAKYPQHEIYNLDALTYAGDLGRLKALQKADNYHFLHHDLSDKAAVDALFDKYCFTSVIHLAAESHVDRSIQDPLPFLKSNIEGTLHLLEAARRNWQPFRPDHCFYHISTDEVYGTLGDTGVFTEDSAYDPRSPYSASKAAADHLVRAYANTHDLPVLISHSCNNYGPWQYPEKLVPLSLLNFIEQRKVALYGDGRHVREWLHVKDHVSAIDLIWRQGKRGETYHIGSRETRSNRDLLQLLVQTLAPLGNKSESTLNALIENVKDRAGHDLRYALAGEKLRETLGWAPKICLEEGLKETVLWYLDHKAWVTEIRAKNRLLTEDKSTLSHT